MNILACVLLASSLSFPDAASDADNKGPTLDEVLTRWEQETSKIKSVEMKFQYWHYDFTFEVEINSNGYFYFESPDKGRLDFLSEGIGVRTVGSRANQKGERFRLRPSPREKLIWTGQKVIRINEKNRSYTSWKIPREEELTNSAGFSKRS